MASRLKRTGSVRLAVGVVAIVISALGASSAQAAVGGAIPLSSTFRPDLRSVTLVSSTAAQFCFDKPLNAALVGGAMNDPSMFTLGGYVAHVFGFTSDHVSTSATGAALDDTNPQCVDVSFPSTTNPEITNSTTSTGKADLNQYTIGSVAAGAVFTNTHVEGNDADSTALTGSDTHNGTTGNTVTPDLTGVTVNTTANQVNYVFNKNIGAVHVGPNSGFWIIDSAGNICRQTTAAAISFSGNVVTVTFPTGPTPDCPAFTAFPKSTNAAVRAGLDEFVVANATANGLSNRDPQVAIVPGTSGTTGVADLISAVVSGDGNHVAYTFDKPIGSVDNPGDFELVLADGGAQFGTNGSTISNTATTGTVTVPFHNGSQFNEYDVKAAVFPGAVTVLNEPTPRFCGQVSGVSAGPAVGLISPGCNTFGSVPVGDNAGAFARGFTTGPDATAVAFNSTAGTATITFDQRVDLSGGADGAATLANIVLLDQDGTPVASAPATGASATPSAAGPIQMTVDFPPAAFSVAKALELCGPPSNTLGVPAECGSGTGAVFSSFEDNPNVQQILSPFATSAVLQRGYHGHWKHATRLSRNAFARQLAAMRHRAHARRTHRHSHHG